MCSSDLLIPALFRFGQGNDAGAVGGVGADDLPVELADFKLNAADALPGFLVCLEIGRASCRERVFRMV